MQNNNIKLIKDIADVILGYTFRNSLEKQKDGDILVLQARNITEDLIIKETDLLRAYLGDNRTGALAKNNDVILSSRGFFKSAVMKIGSEKVVASSSVYLIRLRTNEVLPEYLSIYLNASLAQKQMMQGVTGVVINALLKNVVADIEVIIPSLTVQQKVIDIYFNNLRLQHALTKKRILIDRINKATIDQIISYQNIWKKN